MQPGQLVIDYGCGVGRLSKALIEMFGVSVIGVDISVEMRTHAPRYVGSSAFSAVSRRTLQNLAGAGLRADAAIAVWVLQHCPRPAGDIALLAAALKDSAPVGVVNTAHRCVPTRERLYASDGIDVAALLESAFGAAKTILLDGDAVGRNIAEHCWCRIHPRGSARQVQLASVTG